MNKPTKKHRPKIKQVTKIRSLLQQEINSTCPICANEDIEHFHIHHIDENPENNQVNNLILICPTCHSKITKGDISQATVEQIKLELPSKQQIECASISINSDKCSWKNYDDELYAFIEDESDKHPSPLIVFSLINHSPKTILLKEVQLEVSHLYSGLSGFPDCADISSPGFLKSIASFEMDLPEEDEISKLKLKEEIEVPAGRAFKFEIQIHNHFSGNTVIAIEGRKRLEFSFKFNNNLVIKVPKIFLNCKPDEILEVMLL